jgi:hypothetical protein
MFFSKQNPVTPVMLGWRHWLGWCYGYGELTVVGKWAQWNNWSEVDKCITKWCVLSKWVKNELCHWNSSYLPISDIMKCWVTSPSFTSTMVILFNLTGFAQAAEQETPWQLCFQQLYPVQSAHTMCLVTVTCFLNQIRISFQGFCVRIFMTHSIINVNIVNSICFQVMGDVLSKLYTVDTWISSKYQIY